MSICVLKRPHRRCVVLGAIALYCPTLFAVPNTTTALPEVAITANRYARPQAEVNADTSVLTAEDLKRLAATNVLEALKSLPGVNFSNSGGPQQSSSLFIRGADSKHTLFLIDGQRVGPLDGFTQLQFQHLPISEIDRIEVLRGPASALYGSDAIGGVVQIFTKKPNRDKQNKASGSVDLGYGSNNTRRLGLTANLGGEQGGVRFSVGQELSDGMNARRDNSGDDAYRATGGSLSAWVALGANTEASFSALATDINNEFDPNPQFNRDNQTVLNARLVHRGPQGQESSLRVGSATEELEFPLFNFGTRSFQDQLAVEHRQAAIGGTLLLGYEFLNQHFSQTTSFPPPAGSPNISNTQSHSLLGNYSAEWSKWRVELTARFDNNSNYQDVWTGQASASYPISQAWLVGAATGTGFKRPTFSQISGFVDRFASGFTAPNPAIVNTNLQPEESQTHELFATATTGWGSTRVSVYQTLVEDLIAGSQISPGNTRFNNQNGESHIEGLTLAHSTNGQVLGKAWQVEGSVDVLSARNPQQQRLLRRPVRSAKLNGSVQLQPGTSLSAELLAIGPRDDTVFGVGRVRLGGYGVANAALTHQLAPNTSVAARLENIGGKSYEIASGFNVPRQRFMLTLSQRF